jgi:hypothetical protein
VDARWLVQRVLAADVELAHERVEPVARLSRRRRTIGLARPRRDAAVRKVRVVEPLALDELELAGEIGDDGDEVQPALLAVARCRVGGERRAENTHAKRLSSRG